MVVESPARAPSRVQSLMPTFAEGGIYAVVIVLVVWPGILHGRHEMLGAGDDARYYTWLGWRMGRLIAHGHIVPMRIGDAIAPYGLDLRLLDGYLPSYVSGLFNLIVGPFLAYNLTFVTGAILNLMCARALVRRLSARRAVGVIGAVAFLTAPPIALNVQQGLLPLFWAFPVVLLIADAVVVARGEREVRRVRLALLLVLAYLCSVYFLVFGGIAYAGIVGVTALRGRSWRIPIATAAAVGIAFVLLLPFVVPRISFDRAEQRGSDRSQLVADSNIFSGDALALVAQPSRSTLLAPRPTVIDQSLQRLPDTRYALEQTMFPGLLLLATFVIFLMRPHPLRAGVAATALGLWVLSLGPSLKVGGHFLWRHGGTPVSWLPYRLLLWVPSLGSLRVPIRIGYVVVAVLVVPAAVVLDRMFAARPTRRVGIAAGAGVLLATNLLVPLPTTTMRTTAVTEAALRSIDTLARKGDTVLEVPGDCDPSFVSLQIFHHAPVVGCAGSFAANPWRTKLAAIARSDAIAKLRCDRKHYGRLSTTHDPPLPFDREDLTQVRRQFGVRFVVIDRSRLGFGCDAVAASLPFLESGRVLGADDRYEVVDLGPDR